MLVAKSLPDEMDRYPTLVLQFTSGKKQFNPGDKRAMTHEPLLTGNLSLVSHLDAPTKNRTVSGRVLLGIWYTHRHTRVHMRARAHNSAHSHFPSQRVVLYLIMLLSDPKI